MVLEFSRYVCRQKFRSQFKLIFIILPGSPYIHVLHEIFLVRCPELQTVHIDLSNHLVNGTSGKISFYLQRELRILVIRCKI